LCLRFETDDGISEHYFKNRAIISYSTGVEDMDQRRQPRNDKDLVLQDGRTQYLDSDERRTCGLDPKIASEVAIKMPSCETGLRLVASVDTKTSLSRG
jgi:hypothetical protein